MMGVVYMGERATGVKYWVNENVCHNKLRCFGHVERMEDREVTMVHGKCGRVTWCERQTTGQEGEQSGGVH